MDALRELLAIFEIDVDDKKLKEGHKSVEGFQKKLLEIAKTVTEVFAVKEVYEFAESQIEAAARVGDLAERLDVSANLLRNWGYAAGTAGVDADSAAKSLGFLEKNLGEAALKGGASAAAFSKLGVHFKDGAGNARPLAEVLGDVAEGLAQLPDQNQRAAYATQLFGREGRSLLPILKDGREGIEQLLGEAGALSDGLGDDYYKNAKKADDATVKLRFTWQSIKNLITAQLLPAIQWLIDEVQDASKWMLEHSKTARTLEIALGALAIVIGAGLVDALVTAAAAACALVAPFAPLLLVAAPIAALVWVVQDLVDLMTQGDSTIGRFVEGLAGVGAKTALVQTLANVWAELVGDVDSAAYALGYFLGIWAGVGKALAAPVTTFFKDLGFDIGTANDEAVTFTDILKGIKDVILQLTPGLNLLVAAGRALAAAHGKNFTANPADYGVAEAPAPGPWREPDDHRERRGARTRDVTGFSRGRAPPQFWRGPEPRAPHVGGQVVHVPLLAQGAAAGPSITQTNETHVVVHAENRPDAPAVGDAVGAGIASSQQRNMNRALAAVVKP